MRAGAFFIAGLVLFATQAAATNPDPVCPDRPGKGTGTCTVPAGHWQVEIGLVDWTHDRSGGVRGDFTMIGSSLIKYGVSGRSDIELGIVPYEAFRVRGGGVRERASSFGDMLVRMKYRLTRDDAAVAVTLDPFVKVATANHRLGNGKVEAGLTMPISAALGGPVGLSLTPEVDWRADGDGHGHHVAASQVVGLGFAATPRLSLSAELWGQRDWAPAHTAKQYSADAAVAYLASDSLQLDAGANFGLNRETPDVELYAGLSKRF